MVHKTFVGRGGELETLEAHLQEALEGRGRVVLITGEAGIGKTTLVEHFRDQVLSLYPEVRFAGAECDRPIGEMDVGALSPYAPFKALIAQLVNQERERGEHWGLAYLKEVGPSWLGVIPVLGDLLAAVGETGAFVLKRRQEGPEMMAGGAGQMGQEQMFQQAVNTFKNIATRHNPLVLFVDDWHWADDSSTNLLFHLARQVGDSRILFLAAFRPHDARTAREGKGHPILQVQNEMRRYALAAEMHLTFLGREEVGDYLRREFPGACFAPSFLEWLWDISDGNPLFLSEYVKLLRQDGLLTPEGEFRGDFSQIEVPQGARGVIEERIRRLSDDLRRTLAYASAEGERFTTLVLARLLQSDRLSLLEKLQVVERVHELIASLGVEVLLGEKTTRYAFNHTLVYRVFYESLNEEQRELLHGVIVELMGEEYLRAAAEERGLLATKLVAHAAEARDYLQEARYALEAARKAGEVYAHGEALGQCGLGLAALGQMADPGQEGRELEIDLLLERGQAERFTGRWQEARATFVRAAERARATDDAARLASAHYHTGWVLDLLGEMEGALRAYEESLSLFEQLGDRAGLATTYNNIGLIHKARGEYEAALEWYERSVALTEELGDRAGLATTYNNIAAIHYARGEYEAALEWYERSVALTEELGDRAGLATTYNNIGLIYDARGEYEAALEWYERSVALTEELGDRAGLASTYNNVANVHYARGEYEAALEWYEKARVIQEELGDRAKLAATYNNIGEVHRIRGEYEAALEWYEKARVIQEELGDRAGLATTLHNMGHIALAQGDLQRALSLFARSRDLYAEIGLEKDVAEEEDMIAEVQRRMEGTTAD